MASLPLLLTKSPYSPDNLCVCVQEQIKQHKYLIQAASSIATDERKLLPYSDSWCQAATSHLLRSVLPQTGQRFQRKRERRKLLPFSSECVCLSSFSLLSHWFLSHFEEVNLRLLSFSGFVWNWRNLVYEERTDMCIDREAAWSQHLQQPH